MNKFMDLEERKNLFLAKIKPSKSGCLEWQGFFNQTGYGITSFHGKNIRAHRLAWILFRGPIPDGLFILHKCDNPKCVNVEHLFIGTNRENALDASRKGRIAHGERSGAARLTEGQVLEIRKRFASGEPYYLLAKEFNIGETTARHIVMLETWRHL